VITTPRLLAKYHDQRQADRSAHDRDVAAIQATLGDDSFTAAWTEGENMTPEQAIANVLEGAAAS
jgi:hypothetical protein